MGGAQEKPGLGQHAPPSQLLANQNSTFRESAPTVIGSIWACDQEIRLMSRWGHDWFQRLGGVQERTWFSWASFKTCLLSRVASSAWFDRITQI